MSSGCCQTGFWLCGEVSEHLLLDSPRLKHAKKINPNPKNTLLCLEHLELCMCVLLYSAPVCCKTRAPALPKHPALLGSIRVTVCLSRGMHSASCCQVPRGRRQPFLQAWEQLVLNISGTESRSKCGCGHCWPISLAQAGVAPLALLPAGTCLGAADPQDIPGTPAALCAGFMKTVSSLDAQLIPSTPLLCPSMGSSAWKWDGKEVRDWRRLGGTGGEGACSDERDER